MKSYNVLLKKVAPYLSSVLLDDTALKQYTLRKKMYMISCQPVVVNVRDNGLLE